jgi:hypothetical protein
MDTKEIIIQLDNESVALTKKINTIRAEMSQLEISLYATDSSLKNIQTAISVLNTITKPDTKSESQNEIPIKKSKIAVIKTPTEYSTLKERIIECLQDNNGPMSFKEIHDAIKTTKDKDNLLRCIYGTVGNNKHVFFKDEDKKWNLKYQIGVNL